MANPLSFSRMCEKSLDTIAAMPDWAQISRVYRMTDAKGPSRAGHAGRSCSEAPSISLPCAKIWIVEKRKSRSASGLYHHPMPPSSSGYPAITTSPAKNGREISAHLPLLHRDCRESSKQWEELGRTGKSKAAPDLYGIKLHFVRFCSLSFLLLFSPQVSLDDIFFNMANNTISNTPPTPKRRWAWCRCCCYFPKFLFSRVAFGPPWLVLWSWIFINGWVGLGF